MVIGNWRDENFLKDRVFDTVLADYLVGAIDGFAPYFQVKSCRPMQAKRFQHLTLDRIPR